jgi:carboxylate-amine ligase
VAGLDVVRDDDGQFRVLEDNARNPSGIAYAAAVSDAVADVLGVDRPPTEIARGAPAALRRCLEASAPGVNGVLVLLTEGPGNSAYFEHRWIADAAGLELVELSDLRRIGETVTVRDGRRVRAVYRRTGQDRVRNDDGTLTPEAELLLEPTLSGELGMANWYGAGVADDKSVYAYVDDLIRHVLGQEPLVPSVPTYDLHDPERLEEVLDRLEDLVVKPRDGYGGHGVVVGPAASGEELAEARSSIRQDPAGWIAQEPVALSTHPTVVDGDLVPRRVDLRPFAFNDGEDVAVPTGGLTRVAIEEGEVIVNSSRDGGGKATWVV